MKKLLAETAQQPDILYLVIIDQNCTAVAHSDRALIGKKHKVYDVFHPLPWVDRQKMALLLEKRY